MKNFSKNDPFAPDASLNIPRKKNTRSYTIDAFLQTGPRNQQTMREPLIQRRAIVISFFVFFAFSLLFVRLFTLQSKANDYLNLADNNRIRLISEEAPRGIVYDRTGKPLTKNSPDVGIFVSVDELPNTESERLALLHALSEYTNSVFSELETNFLELITKTSVEPLPLIEHITHDQAIMVSIHKQELPGIIVSPKILREYPYGELLSHVLGYTGKITDSEWMQIKDNEAYTLKDTIGKLGIEQQYESILKGQNGKQRVEVNALGEISKIVASEPPVDGQSITLSIDVDFQQILFDAVKKAGEESKSSGGAAVALNPKNGEVLALVSWPSFDNNVFAKGISSSEYAALLENPQNPLFNRSISGEYPSGSTIKPLIASAALQEGIITTQTTVNSVGGIRVGEWFFPDWKAGGHGLTNVTKAIAESVNTFFYAIGGGYETIPALGVDRIREYAERFGLNATLGIDLSGEASGFFPTKEWKESVKGERWYVGDTYHLAIGQGDLLVTPLQIASYISTIANGGTVYTPRVLLKINNEVQQPKIIAEHIIDAKNLSIVREGMRQTILSGSARSLQSVPLSISGKTGTAQFGTGEKNHAWFAGFAPSEDPEVAIVILLEGGGEGSSVAVPVANTAFTWWANNR